MASTSTATRWWAAISGHRPGRCQWAGLWGESTHVLQDDDV